MKVAVVATLWRILEIDGSDMSIGIPVAIVEIEEDCLREFTILFLVAGQRTRLEAMATIGTTGCSIPKQYRSRRDSRS